jgi:hypothetical protein
MPKANNTAMILPINNNSSEGGELMQEDIIIKYGCDLARAHKISDMIHYDGYDDVEANAQQAIDALEGMITHTQANSLEGVAIQLMILQSYTEGQPSEKAAEKYEQAIKRMAYSMMGILSRHINIKPEEYAREAYMPEHLSPWQRMIKAHEAVELNTKDQLAEIWRGYKNATDKLNEGGNDILEDWDALSKEEQSQRLKELDGYCSKSEKELNERRYALEDKLTETIATNPEGLCAQLDYLREKEICLSSELADKIFNSLKEGIKNLQS